MSKVMLINVILEEESRVAIVDNGILDFFEIETLGKASLKGNIYKGVVENVNSALQAAFVNCGWDKPGFLPLDEVNFRVLPSSKGHKGPSRIQDHLGSGKEVMVQVIRDRLNNKPPSLTTYYSLPGRYLVLTPHTDASGISRRIEDEDQRSKLKRLIEDLRAHEKYGVIVRTAGLDQDRRELTRDLGFLIRLWETIEQAAASVPRAPCLIYKERGLALRTIRDHLTEDIDEVWIDDEDVYQGALRFVRAVAPHQESRIHLYKEGNPLFARFNLEDQIETIYRRRVPLKSGGEIVIEGTEAMTAIDVNSSRSRESSVEELALRTNLEAAAEIARQLRLRDIGGLIVIDFIDMTSPKQLRSVEKVLGEGMRRDKAKYDATRISKLGILEISRQRLKAAKSAATYVSCPTCDGAGSVRTTEAAAFSALRRIQTRVVRGDVGVLTAAVPQEVALYLLNVQREELVALEGRYGVRIELVPRLDFPKERCEIEVTPPQAPKAPGATAAPAREARESRPSAARGGRAAVSMEAVLKAAASAPVPGGGASSDAESTVHRTAATEDTTSEPALRQRLASPFAPSADEAEVEVAHEMAKARQRAGDDGDGGDAGGDAERGLDEAREEQPTLEASNAPEVQEGMDRPQGGDVEPSPSPARVSRRGRAGSGAAGSRGVTPAARGSRRTGKAGDARRLKERGDAPEREALVHTELPATESQPLDEALQPRSSDEEPLRVPSFGGSGQSGVSGDAGDKGRAGEQRHRRGGGRERRHGELEVGGGSASEADASPHPVEARERRVEGHIVWEDAEEGLEAAQTSPSPAREQAVEGPKEPFPSKGETLQGLEGAPIGGKKRRRRRGGKGRRKPGADSGGESATVRAPASSPPESVAALPSADRASEARADERTGPKKRRRRRRGHGRKEESGSDLLQETPPHDSGRARSRDEAAPVTRTGAPAAGPPYRPQGDEDSVKAGGKMKDEAGSDEDVPGGWWSRLRGGRKNPDRED